MLANAGFPCFGTRLMKHSILAFCKDSVNQLGYNIISEKYTGLRQQKYIAAYRDISVGAKSTDGVRKERRKIDAKPFRPAFQVYASLLHRVHKRIDFPICRSKHPSARGHGIRSEISGSPAEL